MRPICNLDFLTFSELDCLRSKAATKIQKFFGHINCKRRRDGLGDADDVRSESVTMQTLRIDRLY